MEARLSKVSGQIDPAPARSTGPDSLRAQALFADGTVMIETIRQQLFFLFPQDVGEPALTLANGHAVLTLDIATAMVTALHMRSKSIDVCRC